jgi:hypothetical protein
MTTIELQEKGYRVLVENLGQVEAIRFLQQCGWGQGNYTQERSAVLDSVKRAQFLQDLQVVRNRGVS